MCIRDSSKVGTLSKKVKAPKITEADKLKAAIEVQKNSIKGSIFGRETECRYTQLHDGCEPNKTVAKLGFEYVMHVLTGSNYNPSSAEVHGFVVGVSCFCIYVF